MHKLDRTIVPSPDCLGLWDYQIHTWDDFTHTGRDCKRQVRLALQRIQGQQISTDDADDEAVYILGLRCAYCEAQIFYGGHIEHFRRKNKAHFPYLTFEWTNLFLACVSQDHCGHYKDRSGAALYNPDELIKPDEHEPDDYLYFHSSGEARVRNRGDMSEQDRRRGSETIRVFNLNCGSLCGSRRKALKLYLDRDKSFMETLMAFDEQDRQIFISDEIEATKWEPYWTTIRHFFEKI